jgi:hypothetical protein
VTLPRRHRRSLAGEAGMTVAEAVIATFLMVLGAMAVMSVISAGTRNTFRAEQSQVVVNRLQEELETIKQLPFEEIALPSVPEDSGDPENPNSRISGTQYDIDPDGGTLAPIVYDGSTLVGGGNVEGGQVTGGPAPFESGDITGDIYRYVVWLDDPSCSESLCPGAQDLKRVVVAIKLDDTAAGGARAYQELHTDVADPETLPEVNPGGGGGGGDGEDDDGDGDDDDDDEPDPYPWNFWLTDTTCDNSSRQPITDDHNTHNTRGICSDGLETGSSSGAPDLMFPEAPPLDDAFPPDQQPLYDYAEDVEPSTGGTLDKGVQLREPGGLTGNGCLVNDLLGQGSLLPPLESTPGQKIHKWLAPPIPSGVNGLLMTGDATLHLWTQTLNGANHAGKLCIYLFRRQLNLLGNPVDTPVVNLTPPLLGLTYFEYEQNPWPRNSWQKLEIPLNFALDIDGDPIPLIEDTQLGLAIRVERQGTGGDALQFMYDHPSFDSRLVVNTNQELPF